MSGLAKESASKKAGLVNALLPQDQAIHGWYRFVLSYPPHLVRQYEEALGFSQADVILDPFCGTGTTLVEAKKRGIVSVGCDAHPFAAMVSRVKTNWLLDTKLLRSRLRSILRRSSTILQEHDLAPLSLDAQILQEEPLAETGPVGLSEEGLRLLPAGFLSARPLRRLLLLRAEIETVTTRDPEEYREFFWVAFAHVIANGAGNFAFGPEIYRTKPKSDYDVLGHFARHADAMVHEMGAMQASGLGSVRSSVLHDDARSMAAVPEPISGVITSPPYPNEKDYTRTTRVESILLGLVTDRLSLRQTKDGLLRSNTRNVFVADQDAEQVSEFTSIRQVCREIEDRRIALGKTSGFERLYHKVVAHYFGGMRLHFRSLRPKLRPEAKLAYVVGDQLSFLMVPVPTAKLLGEVAESEGFQIIGCDLWRERVGTKVRNDLAGRRTVRVREEVLLLKKR